VAERHLEVSIFRSSNFYARAQNVSKRSPGRWNTCSRSSPRKTSSQGAAILITTIQYLMTPANAKDDSIYLAIPGSANADFTTGVEGVPRTEGMPPHCSSWPSLLLRRVGVPAPATADPRVLM
jgi:hypothetical protein